MPLENNRFASRAPKPALGTGVAKAAVRAVLLATCSFGTVDAFAAPPILSVPVDSDTLQGQQGGGAFGFLSGIERNQYMLGDLWGLRPWLGRYGVTLTIQETSEMLGNVSGGTRKGFVYDGVTLATLQMDTQRAFGWYGGTFNASALQIHGHNLSDKNLGSPLQTVSGIEANRATRLWELWYQQKFLDEDRMDVRVGQQSLDQEFMVSQNALMFVNTMFGWPMLPSADMPGGGPAYPLSTPGIRLRGKPTDSVTVLAGLFNGRPMANAAADSQANNANGLNFRLTGKPLAIAEIQFAYPSLGTMLYAGQPEPLARTYKLGVWYDGQKFADQRWDENGVSLGDTVNTTGNGRQHHGNYAFYAVADQMIWQQADELDRTLNLFLRAMWTPLSDRNPVDFSLNAGVTMHEPFFGRDDDTFGVGMGYTHVSSRAADVDRDTAFYSGTYTPIRNSETFVEVTYQYQVAPWFQLQPDFQYLFNPGGGTADSSGERIKNETVLGMRTNILF